MKKKITCFTLIIMLLITFTTAVFNTSVSASDERKQDSQSYVNPISKGVKIADKSDNSGDEIYQSGSNDFNNEESAATYLRKQMVNRVSTVVMHLNKTYNSSMIKDIFNRAIDENRASNSDEGDYLLANFSGYSANSSYRVNYPDTTITFNMEYLSTYSEELSVKREVKNVLNNLNVYNTDEYTKILAVHDYIVTHISYDDSLTKYSTYNAIVEKNVVCQGFASLTYKMLKDLGVGVRYIGGNGISGGKKIPHAWNIIKLDNCWYNTDNTWDENIYANYKDLDYAYNFFLLNEAEFNVDHVRDDEYNTSAFKSKYPIYKYSFAGRADINKDGKVDSLDFSLIAKNYNKTNTQSGFVKYYDIKSDGIIDIYDISEIASWL